MNSATPTPGSPGTPISPDSPPSGQSAGSPESPLETVRLHEDEWGDTVDENGVIVEDVQDRIEDAIHEIEVRF